MIVAARAREAFVGDITADLVRVVGSAKVVDSGFDGGFPLGFGGEVGSFDGPGSLGSSDVMMGSEVRMGSSGGTVGGASESDVEGGYGRAVTCSPGELGMIGSVPPALLENSPESRRTATSELGAAASLFATLAGPAPP